MCKVSKCLKMKGKYSKFYIVNCTIMAAAVTGSHILGYKVFVII